MKKYRCEDCGHTFEGDLSTMQCPICGSANIKETKSKFPWKYVAIGFAALGLIVVAISLLGGEDKLEASLNEKSGVITIQVDGVNPTTLNKEYKIVVYDDRNQQHGDAFGFISKKDIAQYSVRQLLEGHCYSFEIERKDGKPIQNLNWKTAHNYCVPIPPVRPEIDHIEQGVADHVAQVWNNIKIVMKQEGDFTYAIGGISQNEPIFNGINPGSYEVLVKNKEGVTVSQPIVLPNIRRLEPPLTLQQVQDIFNKVSNGSMSASDAQDKLAEGNVNLASVMQPGDIRTLWGALMEAAMGEKFVVVSFENNPNTNKIKSGTLKLGKQ